MNYCSLHQHSDASFLDSCNKPSDLAKKAKAVGMKAIALTDHGNVHNFVKMHNACKKEGVKFIPGCEFYFTHQHDDRERKSRHITILARNNDGLRSLYKLTTVANRPVNDGGGFFYRPRIDWSNLEEHHEGLIILTGCMNSPVNHEFGRNEDYDTGKEHAQHLLDIVGSDSLFVELQMVNDPVGQPGRTVYIPEQDIIFEWSRRLASDLGLKAVCTNDSHYLNREDAFAHEILKCLDAKATLETPVVDHNKGVTKGRLVFNGFDYHVKSTEEMRKKFTDEEIAMTEVIADMCDVEFKAEDHMPLFKAGMTPDEAYNMMLAECRKGWVFRKIGSKQNKAEYEERIKIELADIRDANLANYFLIVWDVLRFCRSERIPVGPGRGSAAGALVAYLLQITQVDPIKHGLLWERFWNRGRKGSMPDIDVDVSIRHKGRVVEYIKQKFGEDRVFPMMTMSTLSTKQSIKDVGKSVGLPFAYVNELNKHVPHKCKNIAGAIEESETIRRAAQDYEDSDTDEWNERIKELTAEDNPDIEKITYYRELISNRKQQLKNCFEVAQKLEGIARQRSTHACAILISNKPVNQGELPLCWDTKKKQPITGFDMYDLEELGFLKLDILGLKTLDVIADCHPAGAECLYDPEQYFGDFDDMDVYRLISLGHTKGVFQLESQLGRQWCRRTRPRKQDELSDLAAILRPAVLEIGMADEYLRNRADPNSIAYIHKDLVPILRGTYGCQLYQEQMIAMVKVFAGFDLAEADALRKAVGKKIPEKLAAMKDRFIQGVMARENNQELADELWSWIEKGAEYGFNKSHSMCYGGFLSYITAWCKVHYPCQFYLAMLKFSKDEADPHEEIMQIFYDAKLHRVSLLPPSLQRCNKDFELDEPNRQIFFGLSHIKHIGASALGKLEEIKTFNWKHVLLHRGRYKINTQVFEALIHSGAFDAWSVTRKNMYQQYDFLYGDDGLTDKEREVFAACWDGTLLTKETKKDGKMTFQATPVNGFDEAVSNFLDFLEGENEKMKLITSRRVVVLKDLCRKFLGDYTLHEEYGPCEKAGYETYYLSVPVTCSEVDIYQDNRKTHHLVEVEREAENVGVCSICLVNKINERTDKHGRKMAFVGFQDRTYQMDGVMFNDAWRRFGKHVKIGKVVLVEAKKRRGSMLVDRIEPL